MTKSVIFHVFSEPLPTVHFRTHKLQKYLQKCDFRINLGPKRDPNVTIGAPVSAKKAPKVESPQRVEAPWGRPERDLRPKIVQGHSFIDLRLASGCFGTEICQISNCFLMIRVCCSCFCTDFRSTPWINLTLGYYTTLHQSESNLGLRPATSQQQLGATQKQQGVMFENCQKVRQQARNQLIHLFTQPISQLANLAD